MIIKNSGRNNLALPFLLFLHLQRCIQINDELQLQTIVKGDRIKFSHTGLIVHDLHIDRFICSGSIHPVDPPLKPDPALLGKADIHRIQLRNIIKRQFNTARSEASGRQLFMQRPRRSA